MCKGIAAFMFTTVCETCATISLTGTHTHLHTHTHNHTHTHVHVHTSRHGSGGVPCEASLGLWDRGHAPQRSLQVCAPFSNVCLGYFSYYFYRNFRSGAVRVNLCLKIQILKTSPLAGSSSSVLLALFLLSHMARWTPGRCVIYVIVYLTFLIY